MTTTESTETIEETGTVPPDKPQKCQPGSTSEDANPDAPPFAVDKVRTGQHFSLLLVAKEEKGMPVLDLSEGDLPKEVIVDILISVCHKLMHELALDDFRRDSERFIERLAEHRHINKQAAGMILMNIVMEGPNALQALLGSLPGGLPPLGGLSADPGTGQYL